MKKHIFVFIFAMFAVNLIFSQQDRLPQNVHKYITHNAWELLKNQTGLCCPVMQNHMGYPENPAYEGTEPWQMGTVITGAFREDEEDVVYGYEIVSGTHFWDPEDFNCDPNPDNSKFRPWDYCYENSYVKLKNYWFGKKYAGQDWLTVRVTVNSGPQLQPGIYNLLLRYDDLSNVYKNNQIYVTCAYMINLT